VSQHKSNALTDAIFPRAARRHIALLGLAMKPALGRLDRSFRALLRENGYGAGQIRSLVAITPGAAARLRSLREFLEQVEYNGCRLAKMNVQPAEIHDALRQFRALLEPELEGRYAPAREQLRIGTLLTLENAFYQVRESEAQTFFGLYHAEAEATSLPDMLQRFVHVLMRTFGARAGRLMPLGAPLSGHLARPLYIRRGDGDQSLIADPAMRGRYASCWSYPVRPESVLQFGFDVAYPWLPRELALLDAVAVRCQEAIERVRLAEEIRHLAAEAREAEEDERRRIGRDLHDEAGQSLLLLRLQLDVLAREVPAALVARLKEARETAGHTVTELRRIVAALGPAALDHLGLEGSLHHLASRFRKMHSAQLRCRIAAFPGKLPRQAEEVIYRVAQESLQNIAKHSHATHVNLSLRAADRSIRLGVSDNGAGFGADTAETKPMSFGMAGMRERAALLGGTLAVRSAPGKGASVVLRLPLDSERMAQNV
jgi:signal transduction histidine kinase